MIRNFIRHRFDTQNHRMKIAVTPAVKNYYLEKIVKPENRLKMEPLIKTMGQPYIPGSSLKGAIRTAVLNYWANSEKKSPAEILNILVDKNGNKKEDISLDVFKYLKVPDIHLPEDFSYFAKISLFTLKPDKKNPKTKKILEETKIPLTREVTSSIVRGNPGTPGSARMEFPFDLKLDEKMMKHPESKSGRKDLTFPILWQALSFYDRILFEEAKKWSEYNDRLKAFYTKFQQYLDGLRKESDIKIIKLGFGSGFDAVTIHKLRDEKQKHGKSIQLLEQSTPLGWVIVKKRDKNTDAAEG